jgi:geranylgeranyl pyrophosphate synthase
MMSSDIELRKFTSRADQQPSNVPDDLTTNNVAASAAMSWAANRVDEVDRLVKHAVRAPGTIGKAALYHLVSKGKMFRPMFMLSVAHAVNATGKAALQAAAACELLHNASLIHDDVQDRDETRRGQAAVWRVFGPEMAINTGDYFIASTFRLLANLDCSHAMRVQLTDLFSETTRQVIQGQSEEMNASRDLSLDLSDYERIARLKSGMLLALPVTSALLIAETVSAAHLQHASSAMQWLGVAYQIQDDLVDLFGLKDGRPAGVDLREGRVNLPVIYFSRSGHGDVMPKEFATFFESLNSSPEELEYWLGKIRNSESVEQCIGHMNIAVARASEELDHLPGGLQAIIRKSQEKMLRYIDIILKKSNAPAP